MSGRNSIRKLQILYFSKKNKKIKNLKNGEKSDTISAVINNTCLHFTQSKTRKLKITKELKITTKQLLKNKINFQSKENKSQNNFRDC